MSARRQSGFTLLEVMVAFTLFVLVVGLLLETLGLSMRATRVADEVSRAALWAQTRLDAIGVESKLAPGTQTGRFDDTYRYELTIRPHQPTDSPAAATAATIPIELYEVELKVYWRDRVETFTTLRGRMKDGAAF